MPHIFKHCLAIKYMLNFILSFSHHTKVILDSNPYSITEPGPSLTWPINNAPCKIILIRSPELPTPKIWLAIHLDHSFKVYWWLSHEAEKQMFCTVKTLCIYHFFLNLNLPVLFNKREKIRLVRQILFLIRSGRA